MRVAIYIRVSTQEQADEGFSLDAQLYRLRAYSESQGWTVVDVYADEGISAKDMVRPQLQRMLHHVKEKKLDVVLVYKLDRLTRSVRDLYDMLQVFDKYDVGFKSATEVFDTTTAMGRLFITIVAALAQWERETIGERSREGQAQMVREGRYFGHTPPYGYDLVDGQLFINPIESEVIRKIFDLYLSGNGVSRIVKFLNDPSNYVQRPHGSDLWSIKVVNWIVKNPVYCGCVRYGNKTRKKMPNQEVVIAKGSHESIIDEVTFQRAQRVLESRKIHGPRSASGNHPLTGILKCGLCGGAMIGQTQKISKQRKTEYHGYMCNERRHKRICTMKQWSSDVVEPALIDEVERTMREELKRATVSLTRENESGRKIGKIEAQLAKLKQDRKRMLDAYKKEAITADDLREELQSITQDEESLRAQLERAVETPKPTFSMDDVRNLRKMWSVANPLERREIIRSIVETAWIYPDGSVRVELRSAF